MALYEFQRTNRILSLPSQNFIFISLIAVSIWLSRFLQFQKFGLYEDDLLYMGGTINLDFNHLKYLLSTLNLSTQGRPVGFAIAYSLTWVGYQLSGDLGGIYVLGYLIVLANSILFYFLLIQFLPRLHAKLCCLAFALFPADTTQAMLTHTLILQPAITFILIAALFYISNRKTAAYIAAALSLLCYEPGYPVLLIMPFLASGKAIFDRANNLGNQKADSNQHGDQHPLLRELFLNSIILGVIFVSIFIGRKLSGDVRVSTIDFGQVAQNIAFGPFISTFQYFSAPGIFLKSFFQDPQLLSILVLFASLTLFCLFIYLVNEDLGQGQAYLKATIYLHLKRFKLPAYRPKFIALLLLVSIIALVLSYTLTFTTSATAVAGRSSRVHSFAVFGAATLIGTAWYWLLQLTLRSAKQSRWLHNLCSLAMAVFFSALLSYGLLIQKSFIESWNYQRDFWTQVVRLAPDITDGTNVFADILLDDGTYLFPHTDFVYSLAGSHSILYLIYQFPAEWKAIPRTWTIAISDIDALKSYFDPSTQQIIWPVPGFWEFQEVVAPLANSIVLAATENGMIRVNELDGMSFKAPPPAGTISSYPRKNLYRLLIKDDQ